MCVRDMYPCIHHVYIYIDRTDWRLIYIYVYMYIYVHTGVVYISIYIYKVYTPCVHLYI